MNRLEIQKSFKRICPPQHGEKQDPNWFQRTARKLSEYDAQWDTKTVRYLWKDDRADLDDWQGHSIRQALSSLSSTGQPRPTITQKNYQDLEELKELKRQIRKEILNELAGTFQKLGEADAR